MAYLGHKPAVGENNSFRILDDISSFVLTFDGSSASAVGLSDETITITENNHRFITGQRVTYSNGGGGNITGLVNGQAYFVINHSKTQIKLASSASNALAGTAVNLTGLGTGSSHTLTLAFDGINTKFDPTFGNGMHDTLIKRAAQLVISINGVIQQPHDTATPSTGFGVDSLGHIIFSTAPASTDIFWGHILASNTVTFDSSDNDVDTFTGNGSTTSFTLSKIPPDNRNILVTIDGVVQYPSDAANTRSYNVSENVMTFVAAPGLGTVIQVRHIGYAGIGAGGGGGVTGFYGRTGNVSLISTDNITVNDAAITGNVSITGNLTVDGDTTTLNTTLREVELLRVDATNDTLAAGIITQRGSGDILSLYDNTTEVFSVEDGGTVKIAGNRKLIFNNPGLEIYHNNSNAYFDNNVGHMYIRNDVDGDDDKNIYIQAKSGENGISVGNDGAVVLYNDSAAKLQTTSTGTYTTGIGTFTNKISVTGSQNSELSSNILSFDRAGYSYIDQTNDAGSLVFRVKANNTVAMRMDSSAQSIFGASAQTIVGYAGTGHPHNNNNLSLYGTANIGLVGQYSSFNMPMDHSNANVGGNWWMLGRAHGTTNEWGLSSRPSNSNTLRRIWRVVNKSDNTGLLDYQSFHANNGFEALRIDNSGRLMIGSDTTKTLGSGQYGILNVEGYAGASTLEAFMSLSRGEVATTMSANDEVGNITFNDKAGYEFARIQVAADNGTGTTDTPGRIVFKTTADGSTSGTNRLIIDSNGHISVKGTNKQIRWYRDADDRYGALFYDGGNFTLQNPTNDNFQIQTSGGTLLYKFQNSGKLGIGIGNPDSMLHVHTATAGTVTADADADELVLESSGNTGMSILSPGSGESSIYFGNPGTNGQKDAWIKYYHETHSTTANRRALAFRTSGTERLRIDGSGRLIIGDTANRGVWGINPQLQVNGTEWDDTCIALHNFGNNTRRPTLLFTKGRSGTLGNFGTAVNAGEGLGIIGWAAHDTTDAENLACYIQGISESAPTTNNQYGAITFTTVNGGTSAYERLRITASGDVTTTGTSTFNRQNAGFTARAGDSVSITRANGTPLELNRTGSDGQMIALIDDNTVEASIGITSGNLFFGLPNSSTPRLTIKSDGNVGINETNPLTQFIVKQDGLSDNTYSFATTYKSGNNASGYTASGIQITGTADDSNGDKHSTYINFNSRDPSLNGNHGASAFMVLSNPDSQGTYGTGQFDFYIRNGAPYSIPNDPQASSSYWMESLFRIESNGRVKVPGELRVDRIIPASGLPSSTFGGVVQIRWSANVDNANYSSTSDVTMQTVNFTPLRTSSRVLIHVVYPSIRSYTTGNTRNRLNQHIKRDGNEIYTLSEMPQWRGANFAGNNVEINHNVAFTHIDHPNTTNQVTYTATWQSVDGHVWNTASGQMVMIVAEISG